MARGSIRKRSNIYYCIYRVNGKQKWEAAGPTKKHAEQLLAKRMHDLHAGMPLGNSTIVFRDFATAWLSDYAKVTVKASTYVSYEGIVRLHLMPAFGGMQLCKITGAHIQSFLAKKVSEGGLSAKSVVNILIPLKEMFKHAIQWGYLSHDPARAVRRPRVEQEEMDFLVPEEIPRLLDNTRPQLRAFFQTAVFTGMRKGELLALQWGDIDWRASQICVRRSLYRGRFVSPKSRNGVRRIVMSPTLKHALTNHQKRGLQSDWNLVFCSESGHPFDPDNVVKREFQPALTRAGLRRIRFNDLRHTFASLLIANGEDVKFLQVQLGHASAATTLDRYGHLFPGTQKKAGERLDQTVFGQAVSKTLARPANVDRADPRSSIQLIDS